MGPRHRQNGGQGQERNWTQLVATSMGRGAPSWLVVLWECLLEVVVEMVVEVVVEAVR